MNILVVLVVCVVVGLGMLMDHGVDSTAFHPDSYVENPTHYRSQLWVLPPHFIPFYWLLFDRGLCFPSTGLGCVVISKSPFVFILLDLVPLRF